ncbi:DUF4145 domain-containing protein [Candidatus Woesearchaeota archaeon]|nr:MAG: DUF4145 domain-containing protein [Candidatus Woesearchaeota archaeon]
MRRSIQDIREALKSLPEQSEGSSNLVDFRRQKALAAKSMLKGAIARLLKETEGDEQAHNLALRLESASPSEIPGILDQLAQIAALDISKKRLSFSLPRLPSDIEDEVRADVCEVEKCFSAGCYRSAIILCGRLLETALHRKYFDVTGQDLLEKAPGMGLGNLIARLSAKGIALDPGLSNQIHLINQTRIHSVHKKKALFTPSRAQTQAIILYTMDVIEKLFR